MIIITIHPCNTKPCDALPGPMKKEVEDYFNKLGITHTKRFDANEAKIEMKLEFYNALRLKLEVGTRPDPLQMFMALR